MSKRLYELTISPTNEKLYVWSDSVAQIKDAFEQMPEYSVEAKLYEPKKGGILARVNRAASGNFWVWTKTTEHTPLPLDDQGNQTIDPLSGLGYAINSVEGAEIAIIAEDEATRSKIQNRINGTAYAIYPGVVRYQKPYFTYFDPRITAKTQLEELIRLNFGTDLIIFRDQQMRFELSDLAESYAHLQNDQDGTMSLPAYIVANDGYEDYDKLIRVFFETRNEMFQFIKYVAPWLMLRKEWHDKHMAALEDMTEAEAAAYVLPACPAKPQIFDFTLKPNITSDELELDPSIDISSLNHLQAEHCVLYHSTYK